MLCGVTAIATLGARAAILFEDGAVISGKYTETLQIAAGATVTLNGVIMSFSGPSCIECLGDAKIIIADGRSNSLSTSGNGAAIQAGPSGTTLTITTEGQPKRNGVLSATTTTGSGYGAGIGSAYGAECGYIVIDSGKITAKSYYGAGIGSSRDGMCDSVLITGGDISATSSTESPGGAGVGTGAGGVCWDIAITGGTVYEYGARYGAGIGTGYKGTCGEIHIGANITKVDATRGYYGQNPIGAGSEGVCGEVIIADSLVSTGNNDSSTRTLTPGAHYTIIWENDDGTGIATNEVKAGSMPVYSGATPTKADAPPFSYYFTGWSPTVVAATEDATYVATFGVRTWSGEGTAASPYVVNDETALLSVLQQGRGEVYITFAEGLDVAGPLQIPSRITSLTLDLNGGSIVAAGENEPAIALVGATYLTLAGDGEVTASGNAPAVQVPELVTASEGVVVTGTEPGTTSAEPVFSSEVNSAVTNFTRGENGTWLLTTFTEMESGTAEGVTGDLVKVYCADSVSGLDAAEPLSEGVEVIERKNAVKMTFEITPPEPTSGSQFFKVQLGK